MAGIELDRGPIERIWQCPRVAVLAATGGDASASAAKEATSSIPVVFNMGGERSVLPKASTDQVVTSLDRPS